MIFWAADQFTLVARKDLQVLLNTFEEKAHADVISDIQSNFLRTHEASWRDGGRLDQMFVDSPLPTNFDQLTAMNLRLIAETLVQLSPEDKKSYEVSVEETTFMFNLIQELTEIPRESMKELSKKIKSHSPLSVLGFMNSNSRNLKETLKTAAADDFVDYFDAGSLNKPLQTACDSETLCEDTR